MGHFVVDTLVVVRRLVVAGSYFAEVVLYVGLHNVAQCFALLDTAVAMDRMAFAVALASCCCGCCMFVVHVAAGSGSASVAHPSSHCSLLMIVLLHLILRHKLESVYVELGRENGIIWLHGVTELLFCIC